jgi:predicted nucleic acid-binding protein
MNIVDSCGWLEYLADGSNADFFAPAIEDIRTVIVPTICMCEVFKRILHQRDEDSALQAVALMNQGTVVDLTTTIALRAAKLGVAYKIPLADSVILATAQFHDCLVWTQDADFKNLPNVRYVSKSAAKKK